MTKDVEELDEVPDHGPINPALRIIQCDICATESSGFMDMLKRRMGRLSVCRPRIRSRARTCSLPPLVCLPLVDAMAEQRCLVSTCNIGRDDGSCTHFQRAYYSRNICAVSIVWHRERIRVLPL